MDPLDAIPAAASADAVTKSRPKNSNPATARVYKKVRQKLRTEASQADKPDKDRGRGIVFQAQISNWTGTLVEEIYCSCSLGVVAPAGVFGPARAHTRICRRGEPRCLEVDGKPGGGVYFFGRKHRDTQSHDFQEIKLEAEQ